MAPDEKCAGCGSPHGLFIGDSPYCSACDLDQNATCRSCRRRVEQRDWLTGECFDCWIVRSEAADLS